MEVRHAVRPVRHAHDHAGGHLLQHAAQGGLADGEDARGELHRVRHARRDEAGRARHHHEGVPRRHESRPHHHRRLGQGHRRPAGAHTHHSSETVITITVI